MTAWVVISVCLAVLLAVCVCCLIDVTVETNAGAYGMTVVSEQRIVIGPGKAVVRVNTETGDLQLWETDEHGSEFVTVLAFSSMSALADFLSTGGDALGCMVDQFFGAQA